MIFGIAKPNVQSSVHEIVDGVHVVLPLHGLPVGDPHGCKKVADGSASLRRKGSGNTIPWCIAALDGITMAIKNPDDVYHPGSYFTGKGFYALPVQATVDASY